MNISDQAARAVATSPSPWDAGLEMATRLYGSVVDYRVWYRQQLAEKARERIRGKREAEQSMGG